MNSKIIGYIGIATYILSVASSVTDLDGNSIAPIFLIVISEISLITFVILAITRLWKTNKISTVILLLSALFEMLGGIIVLSSYQEYGSSFVIITNIASTIFFLTCIWVIILLFRVLDNQKGVAE